MKKLFLISSIILLCSSCALISTDDHTEVFEKFEKRFPQQSELFPDRDRDERRR